MEQIGQLKELLYKRAEKSHWFQKKRCRC